MTLRIIAKRNGGELLLQLEGELDHHAAKGAIKETSKLIDEEFPVRLTLDFALLGFMDSSGIALIIGAYKKITALGGSFSVINTSKQVFRVLDAAGITALINISQKDELFAGK